MASKQELISNIDLPELKLFHQYILGQLVTFCVPNRRDPILKSHRRGTFYEFNYLLQLAKVVPTGSLILDIGSNVGNHSLFFAKFLGARKIIPFEPNKAVYDVLLSNLVVNGVLDQFDLSCVGYGASDKSEGGYSVEDRDFNQGASRMLPGKGEIEVVRPDEVVKTEEPAFIKIDVEGMELSVLEGLEGIMKRCSPIIMIEVAGENTEGLFAWAERQGMDVIHSDSMYRNVTNHFLVERKRAEEIKNKLLG